MPYTEESGQGMTRTGSIGWKTLNTLLGAGGLATGITALASKEPKHNRHNGYGHYDDYGYAEGCGHGHNHGAPTAFQSWEKSCDDAVELTKAFYDGRITELNEARQAREIDINEKFNIWKSQVDADFGLYKEQRDNFDKLSDRIGALETKVAVGAAVRPYQDRLIQCEIDKALRESINYTDRKTCKAIYGVVGLPSTPTTTVLEGACPNGCQRVVAASADAA